MSPAETEANGKPRPRVTVAALAERDGRFLFVEERSPEGLIVLNQPAGHVEFGESIPAAVVRETMEETGWLFRPQSIVGLYSWSNQSGSANYLRIAIAGTVLPGDPNAVLDEEILRCLWLDREELIAQLDQHRSPLVLRCVDDYLAGERYPLSVLKSVLA